MRGLSEIDKFSFYAAICEIFNHKIGRFDVSVNDSRFVQNIDTLENLPHKT